MDSQLASAYAQAYYLTRLYNVKKDFGFVQDQAGHTTAIYAKTNNKARKRQVEALDED